MGSRCVQLCLVHGDRFQSTSKASPQWRLGHRALPPMREGHTHRHCPGETLRPLPSGPQLWPLFLRFAPSVMEGGTALHELLRTRFVSHWTVKSLE